MDDMPLSESDAKFVEKQVDSGRYRNASEVVSAGLHLLQEIEAETDSWMRREIPARMANYLRDPSAVIPAEDVFDQIDEMYREDMEALRGK